MSYCRFGRDSDVYMYPSALGGITCCACKLNPIADGLWDGSQSFSHMGALAHLQEHIKAGHLVPQYAIDRLEREIEREIAVRQFRHIQSQEVEGGNTL